MKNLKLCDISVKNFGLDRLQIASTCFGYDELTSSEECYVCTDNLIVYNFDVNGQVKWSKNLKDLVSPDNYPVNATCLAINNALCLGFGNGELYTISADDISSVLSGFHEDGILAMEWSPDQELFVIVTKTHNAILMTCTFDVISEANLHGQEFGDKQFITVGWGKKETQFHGSAGKEAAKIKEELLAEPKVSTDNSVKLTWRGDGDFYAVGFCTEEGIRRFKVFDREGVLQYTSEKHQGLESNLCWRPSGNLIASTQKVAEIYTVSFFEKNGLKHGECLIPISTYSKAQDLAWSSDSEVLALLCNDTQSNCQSILLFTMSNFHWYHKQTLSFGIGQTVAKMLWDSAFSTFNNKKLHVLFENGEHISYTWIWHVDHSQGRSDDDDAIVTVIDGKKVLVTGFRQTMVPPPMASLEITVESPVNLISFAPPNSKNPNAFFVCTANNDLVFYDQEQKLPLEYKMTNLIKLEKEEFPYQNYNFYWTDIDILVNATVDHENNHSIKEIDIQSNKITDKITAVPESISRITRHPNEPSTLYIHLRNGEILKYFSGYIEPQDVSLPTACTSFDVICVENDIYYLGLSHKGQLFVNDTLIMDKVSSYYVHTHFLLITTLQHVLLCVELSKSGITALTDYQKIESSQIYKRRIERGAKLVIAVPNDTRTIFQMPRGNIEGIQPRPLSLRIIGEYLNTLKYYEAFDLMRKQRINLNLIYDHDPEKFMNCIDIFLEKIKNNSWLSLFLSDLENIDVTKTMYSSSYTNKSNSNEMIEKKIQKVCDIVRSSLMKRSDSASKILPLITSFVKPNTIEGLASALTVIKELKNQEMAGSKLPVGSDEALKYLLYMVDVNNLFDVALGMYDFDLVLLVATKSQKDPKEYIPMLNELNEMSESYKKFTINKHLKRFDKAVQCLADCGPEKYGELKTFVKYHSLYREALKLFSANEVIYKQISDDYGLYLRLKKQYIEAGVIYDRANNMDKAVQCFKEALEWEMAIKLAYKLPEQQFKELCWDLAQDLKEEKRHKEALAILEKYYKNEEEAILYAVESGQYTAALRMCSMYNKSELKDIKLLPALLEEYNNLLEQIRSNKSIFTRHKDRLRLVRKNKAVRAQNEDFDPSYMNKDSDLYSDAGSTVASSRSSSRTHRSSKNRRKHERKVASLKEGSQYEDVALVMALHTLVTSSFELRTQVKEVNVALMCVDKDREALMLQINLEELLKEMKDSFRDIWTNELMLEATNACVAAQNVPEGHSVVLQGIASLEPHLRIAPVIQEVCWKLEGLQ